jgi:hypothetical protein
MTSLIHHITIDCHDAYELGSWWTQVVGGGLADDDVPGDPEVLLTTADGRILLFVQVPDDKQVKNRVHFDLHPDGATRDEEVERLRSIGAKVFADLRREDGSGWVTMQDPEGNEFCVERSAAERRG